jgi:hypothetical protein
MSPKSPKSIRRQFRFGTEDVEALRVVTDAFKCDASEAVRRLIHQECLDLRAKYPTLLGGKKRRPRAA